MMGRLDELVQVRVNNNLDDPMMSQTILPLSYPMEAYPGDHWVLQDANYNVLGLVDRSGKMVERYEYSPYGERKVFVSAGNNDPGCYAPTLVSAGGGRRTMYTMVGIEYGDALPVPGQPFGLCEFGHQGLPHEEEIDNGSMIQNRMRIRRGERWYQRDPEEYEDGNSMYQYLSLNPVAYTDSYGLLIDQQGDCVRDAIRMELEVPESLKSIGRKIGLYQLKAKFQGEVNKCSRCCSSGMLAGKKTPFVSASLGVLLEAELGSASFEWMGLQVRSGWYARPGGSGAVQLSYDGCNNKTVGGGCVTIRGEGGLILSVSSQKGIKIGGGGRGGVNAGVQVCTTCSTQECKVTAKFCAGVRGRFWVNASIVSGRNVEWVHEWQYAGCTKPYTILTIP